MHTIIQSISQLFGTVFLLFSSFSLLAPSSFAQNCTLPVSSNGDTLMAMTIKWGSSPDEVWNIAHSDSNITHAASEYPPGTVLWSACAGHDVTPGGIPLFGTTTSRQNASITFFFIDLTTTGLLPSLFRLEIRYYITDPTILTDFVATTQNRAKRTDFSASSQVQTVYEFRGPTEYSAAATFLRPAVMTAVDFVDLSLGVNLPLYNDPTQYGDQAQEFPGLACRSCSWPIPFTPSQTFPDVDGACPTASSSESGASIGYSCVVACDTTNEVGKWTCVTDLELGLTQWESTLNCTAAIGCMEPLPLNSSYSAGGTIYGSACPYPPPEPTDATQGLTLTEFADGTSCSVLCSNNTTAGESGFQCTAGNWVDLQKCQPQPQPIDPTCDIIPAPAVGEGRASNCSVFDSSGQFAVGSKCSSYCVDGYQGNPPTADWQCVKFSSQDGTLARWQGGVKCTPVAVCSVAPVPSPGEDLTPCTLTFSHASLGTSCSTVCASPFIGGGGLYVCSQITSLYGGNSTVAWVGSANCTSAPKCAQPPPLNPGEDRVDNQCSTVLANSQAPFDIGSTCISDCASEYDGVAASWTCTSNFTAALWIGGPLCTPKPQCHVPALSLGENRFAGTCGTAFTNTTSQFNAGFSCTSACATGYVGDTGTWLCGSDGTWSEGGPQCRKPNSCALVDATGLNLVNLRAGSNPCLTDNQTQASALWPAGSTCTVGCSAGATGSGGTLTCTTSVSWSNSFKCEAIEPIACQKAPASVLGVDLSSGDHPCQPSTASASQTSGWTAGSECTAACGSDYSGSPAPFICQGDGTWKGGPICQPASPIVVTAACTSPPPIGSLVDFTLGTAPCIALVVGQKYNVGTVCSAGCNSSVSTGSTAVFQCKQTQPGSETASWIGGPVCARSCIVSSIPTDSSINFNGGSAPCSKSTMLTPGSSCTAACTLQSATVLSYRCNIVTSAWDIPPSTCPSVNEDCLTSGLLSKQGGQINLGTGSTPCAASSAWPLSSQCTASCSNDLSSTFTATCGSDHTWVMSNSFATCNQSIIAPSTLTLLDFPDAPTKVIVSAAVAGGLAIVALVGTATAAPMALGVSSSSMQSTGFQLGGLVCCQDSLMLKVVHQYWGQAAFLFLCMIQIAVSISLQVALGYEVSVETGWDMLIPRWAALEVYIGLVGLGVLAVLFDRFCVQDSEAENANYGLIIPEEVQRGGGSGCCSCSCCGSNHTRNGDGTIRTLFCRNRVRSIAVFNLGIGTASLCACILTIINWSSLSALSWVLVLWHLSQGYIVLLALILLITWILGEGCRRITEPMVWRLIIPRVYVLDPEIDAYQYLPDVLEQQVEENEEFQAIKEKRPQKFTYVHWLSKNRSTCWAWQKSFKRPKSVKAEQQAKGSSRDDPRVPPPLIDTFASAAAATATPVATVRTNTPGATPINLGFPMTPNQPIHRQKVSRNNMNVLPPVYVYHGDDGDDRL